MMELRQFRSENCLSYIINDSVSREAVVVDPSMDSLDAYRTHLVENGLKVQSSIDLRTHVGHYSATYIIKREFKVTEVLMGVQTESKRPTLKLHEGDSVSVGSLKFKVIDAPGCSADSIVLLGEGILLSGETLLIGSTGKTQFKGSSPRALFHSLRKLSDLPGQTLIFPGLDQTDLLCSSIKTEWERNLELKLSEGEFLDLKSQELRATLDDQSYSCLAFNLEADPDYSQVARLPRNEARFETPEGARASSISVEKYYAKIKKNLSGIGFIDVREPDEFAAGHMPNVENIPLSQIPFEFERLSRFSRIYFSCLSGRRSERAASTLCYMGLKDVVNVSGGYKAWVNQGLPIVK